MKKEYYDYIVNEIKLRPKNIDLGTNNVQDIECLLCGNTFKAGVKGKVNNYRKHGMKGCKECTSIQRYENIRNDRIKELEEKFELYNIDPKTVNNMSMVKVRNKKCGHFFKVKYGNLLNRDVNCPICNTERKREQFRQFNDERHEESYLLKEGFDAYKQKVYKFTRETYRKHKDKINPENHTRVLSGEKGYHLDHIISVRNSFDLGVPPEVCADYRNMRMVKWKDNNKKWKRSSLRIPEPYYPYVNNTSDEFIKIMNNSVKTDFNAYVDFSKFMLTLYNEKEKFGIYYAPLSTNTQQILGSKNYFKQMKEYFAEKSITLLIIFEDEWIKNRLLVIDKIQHYMNQSEKTTIYARKCEIQEIGVTDKNSFLNANHIQGTCVSQINLGAFHDGKLVAVMTFSKPRILMNKKEQAGGVYELARFATDVQYRIPGIASKLLKHFQRNYNYSEIYSYADRRWSDGNLYEVLGFEKTIVNPPNYHYIINNQRKHRWGYRKDALKEKFPERYNKELTEYQNMLEMGYDRIWDSGSIKYAIYNSY